MPLVAAAAALQAAPSLSCSVLLQRITVTPGTVPLDGQDTHGPLANDPYVLASGLIDGIYDT